MYLIMYIYIYIYICIQYIYHDTDIYVHHDCVYMWISTYRSEYIPCMRVYVRRVDPSSLDFSLSSHRCSLFRSSL